MIEASGVEVPEKTALYRICGEADLLLYIGITKSVPIRWNGHSIKQPWWNELRSLTVEFYDSREEAEAAEEAAIRTERPKYNKRHNDGRAERPAKAACQTVARIEQPKRPARLHAMRYCMQMDELHALPAYIDLATAGRAWSVGPTTSYGLMRRGEFPCPVHRTGSSYRVLKADLMTSLGLGMDGEPLGSSPSGDAKVAAA
jgi:hypothetical protein